MCNAEYDRVNLFDIRCSQTIFSQSCYRGAVYHRNDKFKEVIFLNILKKFYKLKNEESRNSSFLHIFQCHNFNLKRRCFVLDLDLAVQGIARWTRKMELARYLD